MSSMPGAAVATTSITPLRGQPFGDPAEAVGLEILGQRSARTSAPGSGRRADQLAPAPACRRARRRAREVLDRAAARAKTAVTVVFPTPPLPATMATWASVRNCSGFTLFGGTCAQASHHHSHRALCRAGWVCRCCHRRAHASTPPTTRVPADDRRRSTPRSSPRSTCCRSPGIFDKIVVRSIDEAIDSAESNGAEALILQLTSRGAVVSRRRDDRRCCTRVADAKVPIGIWVGPVALVARLRTARAVDGGRRRHRDGRWQPHRLHRRRR